MVTSSKPYEDSGTPTQKASCSSSSLQSGSGEAVISLARLSQHWRRSILSFSVSPKVVAGHHLERESIV